MKDHNPVSENCWKEWISKKAVANAGVVLFNMQQQALLMRRIYSDDWTIPSGAINSDETPEKAAKRELLEETNINISNYSTSYFEQVYIATFLGKRDIKSLERTDITITYWAYLPYFEIKAKVDEAEVAQAVWISKNEMKDFSMHPETNKQLRAAFDRMQLKIP